MDHRPHFHCYNTQNYIDNMPSSANRDYTYYTTQTIMGDETTIRTESSQSKFINSNLSDKQRLQYILDRSARKLRYKSKRKIDYINKMNEIIDELNRIPSSTLANITSHKFYISIRNIIHDLLLDWHSSHKLNREETYLLRNSIRFFNHLVNAVKDVTVLTSWLINSSLINVVADCMSDIDRILSNDKEKRNFKQFTRLLDMFSIYYQRLPSKLKNENGLERLFEATVDCLISSNYDRTFRKLKANAQSMTTEQNFFLIECPSFLISYHGI